MSQRELRFAQMKSERMKIGDVSVESFPLNHPQGAYGYRIEAGGKSIVYATDLEHGDAQLDRILRDYASGADVLIYDAQYNDEEYASHRGWGHSTWREATRVATGRRCRKIVPVPLRSGSHRCGRRGIGTPGRGGIRRGKCSARGFALLRCSYFVGLRGNFRYGIRTPSMNTRSARESGRRFEALRGPPTSRNRPARRRRR